MAKLNEAEIAELLTRQPGWRLIDGALTRDWLFKDFVQAMIFVNRVGALAEEADHHPNVEIRYNKVRLSLISHDTGGLTERDAALASRLSKEF